MEIINGAGNSDEDYARALVRHGKFSRAYLFQEGTIEHFYSLLEGEFRELQPVLPDICILPIDPTAYTAAQAALERAIQNGYDPATDDPYKDRPLQNATSSHLSKRE
ncbi:MAG: hypothetical protein AB7P49_00190 [Bdellovibrionales bacterium]